MLKKIILFFLSLCALPLAADFTLVENGSPCAAIVLAGKPTRSAQLAALELQHIVRLITGAALPIVKEPGRIQGTAIHVGATSAAEKAGLKRNGFSGEEYAVRFTEDSILLAGNDDPDFGTVNYRDPRTFPSFNQNLHATLYAVYDFLEDCCDVRFYLPGDIGVAFTPRKTLTVKPVRIRRKPAMEGMRSQNFIGIWTDRHPFFRHRDTELLRFRWRTINLYGMSNHNTASLWYRYWGRAKHKTLGALFREKRKDYFAQGYDGRFLGMMSYAYPNDPDIPGQVCTTHPDVIRYFAGEVVNAYRGGQNPGTAYPNFKRVKGIPFRYPMLSEDNNWDCRCARCTARYGSLSREEAATRRYFDFINAIAKEAEKEEPEAGIAAGVYGKLYLEGLPLHRNLSLQHMMGIHAWYLPGNREEQLRRYREWRKHTGKRQTALWTYMLSPKWEATRLYKYQNFFPGFYPNAIIDIFQSFIRDGVSGWFAEVFLECNFLEVYLAMHICDKPQDDARKLLAEFYPRFFGPAAEPMKAYYTEVEHTFWNADNYPEEVRRRYTGCLNLGTHTDRINWALGTPERLAKLDGFIRRAESLAKDAPYRDRVKLFRRMIHDQMMRGRKEFEKRESIRNSPIPQIGVPLIPSAGGDARKVDFGKAEKLPPMKTLFNKTGAFGTELRIAYDRDHLYLSYAESACPESKVKNDPWQDSLEIFFGRTTGFPYHHYLIAKDGTITNYRHQEVNGVTSFAKTSCSARIFDNKVDPATGSWSFKAALSMRELVPEGPVRPNGVLNMNIMRTLLGAGVPSLSWSPTFDEQYLASLFRMGKITFTSVEPCQVDLKGDFRNMKRLLDWRIPSHMAKNGTAALTPDGLVMTKQKGTFFVSSVRGFSIGSGNTLEVSVEACGDTELNIAILGYVKRPDGKQTEATYQALPLKLTPGMKTSRLRFQIKDSPKHGRVNFAKIIAGPQKPGKLTLGTIRAEIK